MPIQYAYKESKKGPFLQAFARIGFINHAARSVRISRWAIADWKRNDPVFAAGLALAKDAYKKFKASGFTQMDTRLPSRSASGFLPSHPKPAGEAIAGRDVGSPRLLLVV